MSDENNIRDLVKIIVRLDLQKYDFKILVPYPGIYRYIIDLGSFDIAYDINFTGYSYSVIDIYFQLFDSSDNIENNLDIFLKDVFKFININIYDLLVLLEKKLLELL